MVHSSAECRSWKREKSRSVTVYRGQDERRCHPIILTFPLLLPIWLPSANFTPSEHVSVAVSTVNALDGTLREQQRHCRDLQV